MIHQLTEKTELKIFQKVVDIHRLCISQSNASTYSPEVIQEWLDEVNVEDTIGQLQYTKWIALEKDNNIVGFAQYSLPDSELYQIQIDPNIQRKGYGKELYEYIEEDFKKNNISKVLLYSVPNAVKFYESFGFTTREQNEELTVMTKKL